MPTLDDLRGAFAELERHAPPALSEPVRPAHRRRWVAVGLAAACTAAVAVVVPLATRSGDTPSRPGNSAPISVDTGPSARFTAALPGPSAGTSPALALGFAVPGTVAGYTVIPDEITQTYQHASIYGPTDPPGGEVFVYYGGAYDATRVEGGTPVDVNGRRGYYADVTLPDVDGPVEALVWQYADDGWAIVRLGIGSDDSPVARPNELLLADALVPASDAMHSPVAAAAGAGLHVDSLSGGGPDGSLVLSGSNRTWTLGWGPGTLHPSDKPGTSTTRIGDHDWIVYQSGGTPSGLGLIADGWGMTVTPDGTASLAELEQFAGGLHIAPDPSNPNTWFDAEANLP